MSSEAIGNSALAGGKFDVLIVGSGAGGGSAAHILCKAGLKVLVLEAGPNWFEGLDNPNAQPTPRVSNDELKIQTRGFLQTNSNVDPRTFREKEADGDRTLVGDVNPLPKTVGGGTVHADLKMPRFQPTDFELGTRLGAVAGASFADWPVGYDELEPYYAYVERAIGVQGTKGADPFEGARSTDLPMPPGVPMYLAELVSKGLTASGYHPFPYPSAINSQPYDGRPACVDCGLCSGYGCPSNAKGSAAVTVLRKALLTGNCLVLPETRASRLILDGAKSSVTAVEAVGPDGVKKTFTADRYVLAASPIEDARILLLSDPAGVGNSSNMVGRNLTFHFQTVVVGVFEQRLHPHRGKTVSHGFSDFRGVPGDATKPLAGIVEIGAGRFVIDEAAELTQAMGLTGAFDGKTFKNLLRQSPLRDRIATLTMQAEDAPQLTNRVDLDPAVKDLDGLAVPRITYSNHAFETSARAFYAPKMVDILGASGAKYAFIAPPDTPPASAHVMGTLRFGKDPKTSVCDSLGRFHDVGNLFAADGSLFPTSSGYNPTLTIMTLATYVAANMAYPGQPSRALA